jgi:ubiquinone/menaquinone biosynthesis C-methylase UbiE
LRIAYCVLRIVHHAKRPFVILHFAFCIRHSSFYIFHFTFFILHSSFMPLLRLAFRLLYNELAWTYDLVSWSVSIGQWRDWQRAALPYLPEGRVLEIAHGPGNFLLDLHAHGFEPVGLDLSPAMSRLARQKLRAHGVKIPLVRSRVQALPFAGGSFRCLVATFPTEFIVDPPAIAEFYRVLAPGGVLVIVPAAQITGPALPDRLAEGLFRLTGQSADFGLARLENPYPAAGFSTRIERVRLPRSVVTVVIATKSR